MMKQKLIFTSILFYLIFGLNVNAQGLKTFKLPNGINVFIWEDFTVPDVYGSVVFNVGAKEDPENLTGLAHYLEHVMFKGTEKIGALDWEKEKPLYEQIIQKYDERATITDPSGKAAIDKEINKLTIEASRYGLTNEFSSLTEAMGGFSLNAGTSYDYTLYYNSFAPGEVYKWLELNSERLINPVFRAFQTELETVYEEHNRSQNNPNSRISEFMRGEIFKDHPYSRPVLGYPEHLKNPQLSGLINFYNEWYVPENMALIIVGNVKTNELLPLIREKFGRLQAKPSPERKIFPDVEFKGRKEVKASLGNYPQLIMAYNGVTGDADDDLALDVCTSILTNSNRTGLLDKLMIDGDVMAISAGSLVMKERGRIIISAVPLYDINQRRYLSLKSVENMILKEIKKIQEGQIENWLVESIKQNMIRQYELAMEIPEMKANELMNAFVYGKDLGRVLEYKEMVAALTLEQIKETAKKYFNNNYIVLNISKGKLPKNEKLEKPDYNPLDPSKNVESDYAKMFQLMPVKYQAPQFIDFDQVKVRQINDKSQLLYVQNPESEIFTLKLKYGIGTAEMPGLELATYLMNNAGIMGQMKAQEVKQAFGNLGTACSFSVDDSYLTITIRGFESNLAASCNLLTRQILFPDLDEKQMNSLVSTVYQGRMLEKEMTSTKSDALNDYLLYKDKSDYIDRPEMKNIMDLTISNLTGEFQRATDYEAEIHYTGSMDIENVYDILSKNLPLKTGEKSTSSPIVKDRESYTQNTVYFVADKEATQSNIYFFVEGEPFARENEVYRNAFNQYFTGGFNGLVMKEIREYRSMAYSAYGYVNTPPPVKDKNVYFIGYIGTQSDKVIEALDVYTGLLNDMPLHPERINNIKSYMKSIAQTSKPTIRELSSTIQAWKMRGYTEDPAKENLKKIDELTFEDIVNYYNQYVKGRPIGIAIIGDSKNIDVKALEKYGKVVKLNPDKLFSDN